MADDDLEQRVAWLEQAVQRLSLDTGCSLAEAKAAVDSFGG